MGEAAFLDALRLTVASGVHGSAAVAVPVHRRHPRRASVCMSYGSVLVREEGSGMRGRP